MPRTPQQNEQLRADSERRLIDAAQATFVRLGVERATVRDIAEEAGVAQGLLYSYFRSKDDLLRAVFLDGARDVAAALDAGVPDADPAERLALVIRRSLETVRARREFWQLSYMLRHQPRTADVLGDELPAWSAAVHRQLESLLRKVGHREARALARVLFAAIDGVAQQYVLDPEGYPLASTVQRLVSLFCQPPTTTHRRDARARRAPR